VANPSEENAIVSSDSLPLDPRALLEHREFVRALAKNLLADEHAAQDVAQDTLLTLITHPPRTFDSLRGWLAQVTRNRVRNAARESERRTLRETAAARHESSESDASAHARLALQHRVVEAVLSLREPYKTVVVLAYYDGLTANEIAARRGGPAGTVRAQLSRALELLREKLDAETDGGRRAWSIALAVVAARSKTAAIGTSLAPSVKVVAACALIAVAVVVPILLRQSSESPARAVELAAETAKSAKVGKVSVVADLPTDPEPTARTQIASFSVVVAAGVPSADELEKMPLKHLLMLAMHTQAVLRERVLAPDPSWKTRQAALLSMKDTGVARILDRKTTEFATSANVLGIREGGAFYSFITRSNDFDDDPTLMLEQGDFQSAARGGVVDLGEFPLTSIASEREQLPNDLDAAARSAWDLFWTDVHTTDRECDMSAWDSWPRSPLYGRDRAQRDHTYLVRSIQPGRHDLLAAFTLLDVDANGVHTIAWRILHQWPIHGPRWNTTKKTEPPWVSESPEWMKKLTGDELTKLLMLMRDVGQRRLLAIPDSLAASTPAYTPGSTQGIGRILERARWEPLMHKRGGGAYYSFATGDQNYDAEPDLALESGSYGSGFAGSDLGFLLDLGTRPMESIGSGANGAPADLTDYEHSAWKFLWTVEATEWSELHKWHSFSPAVRHQAHDLGVDRVPAAIGHTYLVRSHIDGLHDHLVVFNVISEDEAGQFFRWRILKSWPADREKANRSPSGSGR
jgi:RNA polymerase sigma-70 factor (ECF subfamily)